MGIFLASLVFVLFIGILFNTIMKILPSIQCIWLKIRNTKLDFAFNFPMNFEEQLEKHLILNSFHKWKIWGYGVCSLSLFFMDYYNWEFNIFTLTALIIVLLGIGDFFYNENKFFVNEDLVSKLVFYGLQLALLITLTLSFNLAFLESKNNLVILLVLTAFLIFYSFLFLKNIVDVFSSYFFQFLNFVAILLIFNFVVIGFNYGLFYLVNNETFNYYQLDEAESIYINFSESNDPLNLEYIFIVVHEGIEPFFNFPSRLPGEAGLINFVPLIEHFIGNVFNLLIIGFFVSYSVTSLYERRKDKQSKRA